MKFGWQTALIFIYYKRIVFFITFQYIQRKINNKSDQTNEKVHSFLSFIFLDTAFAFCLYYFSIYTSIIIIIIIRPLVSMHSVCRLFVVSFRFVSFRFLFIYCRCAHISITMIKIDRNIFLLYSFFWFVCYQCQPSMKYAKGVSEWVRTIKDIKNG